MTKALLIGAGGFVGSVLRYMVGGLVQAAFGGAAFPVGTLAVNVSGCFVIGVASAAIEPHTAFGSAARSFLVVGLLGGYTTFSTFGHETMTLMRDGHRLAAGLNVGGQILLALLAVWLGRAASEVFWR